MTLDEQLAGTITVTQAAQTADTPRSDRDSGSLDDPRVARALREYLSELEAGRKPKRKEFLAKHGDIAEALSECLAALDFVHSAAPKESFSPGVSSDNEEPAIDGGQPIGDFKIVREIGRGGMGVVYEATQLSLNRRVALKVLPFAGALDARQVQRFKNETHAAAQLHHTNIVPIHFVGYDRGVHYYAMQFIEGHTLADVIAELKGRQREGVKG